LGREVIQVGILFKDVEESESKLERLIGIGPFEILEPEYRDSTFRREPGRFRIRVRLAGAFRYRLNSRNLSTVRQSIKNMPIERDTDCTI